MNVTSIRNWDNWSRYTDNAGNILHGKIEFFYKDGISEVNAPIYDSDANSLQNPQFTDIYGRTESQVFLEATADVRVHFYKYVGNGVMQDDVDDDTKWRLEYTSESINEFKISYDSSTLQTIESIEALRNIAPSTIAPIKDDIKIVETAGYYELGDMPSQRYVWHETDADFIDDGGSVISSATTKSGYWSLVRPSCHCDSRIFGAFPVASKYDTTDHSTKLLNLFNYCNKAGLKPMLAGTSDNRYFNITAVVLNSANEIEVNNYTKIQFVGSNTITAPAINGSKSEIFITTSGARLTLNVDVAYTGWSNTQNVTLNAREVHINTLLPNVTSFANKVLYIETDISNASFDNCEIVSNDAHFIDNITLTNMPIVTSWFASNFAFNSSHLHVDTTDTVKYSDCKDANTYITLKNMLLQYDYGDIGEETVDATIYANSIIENGTGTLKIATGTSGNIELHNFSGTIKGVTSNISINAVDCWLTLDNATVIDSIQLRRGMLTNTDNVTLQILSSCYFKDVNVNTLLKTWGVSNVDFINCEINKTIACGNTINITDSVIHAYVNQTCFSDTVTGTINNCKFVDYGNHNIEATLANTVVNFIWTNNVSEKGMFVTMDRTNLADADSAHSYVYENNSGNGVLQRVGAKTTTIVQTTYSAFQNADRLVEIKAADYAYMTPMNYPFTVTFFCVGKIFDAAIEIYIADSDNYYNSALAHSANAIINVKEAGYKYTWAQTEYTEPHVKLISGYTYKVNAITNVSSVEGHSREEQDKFGPAMWYNYAPNIIIPDTRPTVRLTTVIRSV